MNNRLAYWLAFLAGMGAGGGLLAASGSKASLARPPESSTAAFFYFDLEKSQPRAPRDPKGQLHLVVEPVRVGPARLMVRVEVWNPSMEDKLVHPIFPAAYQLSFKDAAGALVEAYLLPPAYQVPVHQSEFALVEYGNCLATNYMLPTFYKRIRRTNLTCQVRVSKSYRVNSKGDLALFELSSDWVKVPPP